MVVREGRKQQATWQDVRPPQTRPKPAPQPIKKSKIPAIHVPLRQLITTVKQTRIKLPRPSKLSRKKTTLIAATLLLLVVGVVWLVQSRTTAQPEVALKITDTSATHSTATKLTAGTPDYKTILPSGKKIEDFGGWTRVSPPDRNPVFAYVDSVGGSPVTISQQPLPVDFQSDTDEQIQLLAQGYKANEKITVGSTTVYIGTSAKGPQSVIFNKDNLLILIKSSVAIASDQWATYVNSLQ